MKKSVPAFFLGLFVLLAAGSAMAQRPSPTTEVSVTQAPAAEAQPAPQPPVKAEEQRELWSGSLYTSTYRAGACIDPEGKVRGVLLLRTMSGKTDTYHFDGTLEDGTIRASHTSGHRFKGTFPSTDEVKGTITLKSGRSVSLTGKRELNVPLTESCRPLPQ